MTACKVPNTHEQKKVHLLSGHHSGMVVVTQQLPDALCVFSRLVGRDPIDDGWGEARVGAVGYQWCENPDVTCSAEPGLCNGRFSPAVHDSVSKDVSIGKRQKWGAVGFLTSKG